MANATQAHSLVVNSFRFKTPQAKFILGYLDTSPDQIGTKMLSTFELMFVNCGK